MPLTMDEQKERYYRLVLDKANEIYSSWIAKRIPSKRLVAQANEYAFDNRSKLDASYRFHAFAFMVALGIRLKKRYGTFFRRLFRLFAYLRERAALKRLKRVFGFFDDADIRDMIEVEIENIIVLLFHPRDGQSTGGGKRPEMGDITMEEALNGFFEECMQEDEQKAADNNLDTQKVDKLDAHGEPLHVKLKDEQREKISVEEFGKVEKAVEQKKAATSSMETEETEKQTPNASKTEATEHKKAEPPVEKTAASTSILAEIRALEQGREEDLPSPFPIFRENSEGKTADVGKEDAALSKEKYETNAERENGEYLDKEIRVETDFDKSPFPVFRGEKAGEMTTLDKADERLGMCLPANLSEENKARIALNVTMSEEQIHTIVEQLKTAAKIEMEREEQAWRKNVSIANNGNEIKESLKDTKTSPEKIAPPQAQKNRTIER